jgi:hypothetical protein
MPSLSYEKHLQEVLNNASLTARSDKERVIDSFLKPFSLPKCLHEQILVNFDTWIYPYLKGVGSIFPECPLNGELARRYNIHVVSLPDKLQANARWGNYTVPIYGLNVYRYPQYAYEKIRFELAGADSFSRLNEHGYILSGQTIQNTHEAPRIFQLHGQKATEVEIAADAKAFLQSKHITNLYGFSCINETIYFGTWGRPSTARLLRGEIHDNVLCSLCDLTPPEIATQGYDDLFVQDETNGWLKIGGKLGGNTTSPAVYYFHIDSGQLTTIPIDLEDVKHLVHDAELIHNHLYFHQFYQIEHRYHALILSGRVGSLLHIINDHGSVVAKYYLELPNDNTPFSEYAWSHILKHPLSPYIYVPDNNGVVHRFRYDAKENVLYVLKFKLPLYGEISALTATSFGLYIAITCNHVNFVLKLTHDLTCFIVYESNADHTPITSLIEHADDEVIALTGSRFFPYYMLSRYCHYLDPRQELTQSEIIRIKTNDLRDDLSLRDSQEREKRKRIIASLIIINPQYRFFLDLAAMEIQDGNYYQAIDLAKQAIAREITALYPYKILGLACIHTGQFQEASNAFEFFLKQEPRDAECKEAFNYCQAMIAANTNSSPDHSKTLEPR